MNFEPDSRQHYLNLLGYSPSSLKSKVTEAMKKMHVTAADHHQQATVSYYAGLVLLIKPIQLDQEQLKLCRSHSKLRLDFCFH